jgi:hypothetical protein
MLRGSQGNIQRNFILCRLQASNLWNLTTWLQLPICGKQFLFSCDVPDYGMAKINADFKLTGSTSITQACSPIMLSERGYSMIKSSD